ncbi:hypothetical protein HD597_012864 [Nonomuraea thailandensis]|uniref:Helix-turn-helix domain-containing protein n=1 Tax=Nonomuraea thailandensis TaxID=1188745 RepID=A0A9X2GXI0_9ACTN|nr:GntR family transcriptional regulator [Nonomuraea thailandensis]MCP2365760.1 hypothetical protein [Nonomuraea thailandensis]
MGELPGCVEDTPMPGWGRDHLSAKQQALSPALRWITLLYQRAGWDASHVSVAQRVFLSVAFKPAGVPKKDWHTEGQLAADLNLSRTTVNTVLQELADEGWIAQRPRPGGRGKERWLTWPPSDCLTPIDGPERCAAPTKTGQLCIRRAGWGTATPGSGPCKLHRPADASAGRDEAAEPAPGEHPDDGQDDGQDDAGGVQPLNTTGEAATCSTIGQVAVQPLNSDLANGWTAPSNHWPQVNKECRQQSHQSVSAPAPPPEAEPEVPRPRAATDEREGELEDQHAAAHTGVTAADDISDGVGDGVAGGLAEPVSPHRAQAAQILRGLYPCSQADAEAMVDLIGQGKTITDWQRYLAAWTPDSWARWHARVRSTPLPPPARERLTFRPPRDPGDSDDVVGDVLPVDETLARLREQMGWTHPARTPT